MWSDPALWPGFSCESQGMDRRFGRDAVRLDYSVQVLQ